jgi:hypothetical protein
MRKFLIVPLAIFSLILTSLSWGADYAKGLDAYNSADYEAAMMEWLALAESGHADSQFGMALLYANGFGVALDDAEALKWYGLAAEQGHAESMCNIAIMHANGWGVPQSDAEAFKWYGLAAEEGFAMAQINLARMLSDGYWEVQDEIQAYKWLSVASEMGEIGAAAKREDLARKMTAEQIAEANIFTDAWMERYRTQFARE